MFTLLIATIVGLAGASALYQTHTAGYGWSICWGVLLLMAVQIAGGLIVRKKVNRVNAEIQQLMSQMQAKLTRKIEAYQRRPTGNVKQIQQELQEEQFSAIRKSIFKLNELNRYTWWSFMLGRQVDTMRMVMYYQLKEFDKVDKLLPRAMLFSAQAMAMKLARMYKLNDPKIDKFFARRSKRFKGDDAVLLFSLYAWIKLKQDDPKTALEALNLAIKKTDNPVLSANRDRIANGKLKQFSNAGLGDTWYGLYLEEPKIKQQRVAERRFQ